MSFLPACWLQGKSEDRRIGVLKERRGANNGICIPRLNGGL